jgi:hypothetical protein
MDSIGISLNILLWKRRHPGRGRYGAEISPTEAYAYGAFLQQEMKSVFVKISMPFPAASRRLLLPSRSNTQGGHVGKVELQP